MKSRLFPFPLFRLFLRFLPFIIILVIPLASAAYDDEEWFFECSSPFNCDKFNSPPWPLWRSNGTGNCGNPESMKVNCTKWNATIEILGAKYDLLALSMKEKILIIAEIGFPDRFCAEEPNILSSSIYAMLPVYNVCGYPQIPDNLTCSRPEPFGNMIQNSDAHCRSALVPITSTLLRELGDLQKVANHIKGGFEKLDAEICGMCNVPGGLCGYDLLSDQGRCYCQSQLPPNRFEDCSPSPGNLHKL